MVLKNFNDDECELVNKRDTGIRNVDTQFSNTVVVVILQLLIKTA